MKTLNLSKDIQNTVANHVNKTALIEIESHEVGIELLMKVADIHNQKYGFVPESWQEAIDFALNREFDDMDTEEVLNKLLAA